MRLALERTEYNDQEKYRDIDINSLVVTITESEIYSLFLKVLVPTHSLVPPIYFSNIRRFLYQMLSHI